MVTANVYLNFNGNCEEAFNFYKSVFGGEFSYIGRFKDMPQDGAQAMAADAEKIMHVGLSLGGGTALMGSDVGGEWSETYTPGNNFAVSLTAESKDEADRIFNALSNGGKVNMPLGSTFWGDYFGMCTDKFGINWMMSFREKPQKD